MDSITLDLGGLKCNYRTLRHRVTICGNLFWASLNNQQINLIQELLERFKDQEGCVAIQLGDNTIGFKSSDEFDVNNLKPTQAVIIGDLSWDKITSR